MTTFQVHDESSAPAAALPFLAKAKSAFGMVPNLLGIFAESPALLEGYMTLAGIFAKTSFTPIEQQTILLTVSFENSCGYCMAAHSSIASGQGMLSAVLAALRKGVPPPDARLEALVQFTRTVVRERGWAGERDLDSFLQAGFTKAQVLEVVLGVGLKTLSNYANHVAHTPVDAPFQPQAWTAPAAR
jgi:AhpD family alkylhydroperoxidase